MKIIRINPNILNLICIFAIGRFLFAIPAYAQSPTPEETATTPGQVRQEIKKRVQERLENIKKKAKIRAFWGTLTQITNSTLILDTPRGEKRVKTTAETIFVGPGKKEIKFEDLEIGNFLIVMGYLEENGSFTARRVLVLKMAPKPPAPRQAVYGKVTNIAKNTKILTITHPKKEVSFKVKVTEKTIITKKVEGKMKKVAFEEIVLEDRLVAVGIKDETTEIITAKIIHLIPGKAIGLEKEISPTPTQKPSPTPTPAE